MPYSCGRRAGRPGCHDRPGRASCTCQGHHDHTAESRSGASLATAAVSADQWPSVVPRCVAEIALNYDQGGASWRRWPGVSAGLALGRPRPSHAGPHPQDTQIKTAHSPRRPVLQPAVNLAPDCPARGHRVKGALQASPKAIGYRRPLTRRPLTRVMAPARMTDRTRTNKHGPGRGTGPAGRI
jgi:hypothetical protein